MLSQALLTLAVLPCTLAHFQLNWPSKRGFDANQAEQFPCGGFNNVQQQRTDWPISGSPLQLNMEHPQTNVAAYLAIGSNPGSGFSIKLRSQFVVEVLGDFCLGQVSVPSGLNVSDGTPATIQVVTNAHGSGGLYQCADVTLRSSPLSQSDYSSHCKNNTGARVTQENMSGSPNGTSDGGSSQPSGSASGSGAATSPTARPGAASQAQAASWLLGAVGVAGLALL